MAAISQVLELVDDWEGLAGWLNVRSNAIRTDCALGGGRATCHRRTLVKHLCDEQTFDNPRKVTEGIARILEKMHINRIAWKLRRLRFSKQYSSLKVVM